MTGPYHDAAQRPNLLDLDVSPGDWVAIPDQVTT